MSQDIHRHINFRPVFMSEKRSPPSYPLWKNFWLSPEGRKPLRRYIQHPRQRPLQIFRTSRLLAGTSNSTFLIFPLSRHVLWHPGMPLAFPLSAMHSGIPGMPVCLWFQFTFTLRAAPSPSGRMLVIIRVSCFRT